MQVKRGWPWWVLGLAVAIGLSLGLYTADRTAQAVNREELFEAVRAWLAEARVPEQDMPKAIIAVKPLDGDRYLVHMRMVVGEGWFEVSHEEGMWRVKGAPPPTPAPRE